ncbi:acyl-CoA dehydrogenase family protein [Paenibacillus psychroresistens]|nr:acyl-CoA dehydrogenase family protein [Paenibacillus psychroresistens]
MPKEIDRFIRNKREQELAQYADQLASQLAITADIYDKSGDFPFEHYDILRKNNFFDLTIPEEYGGRGISLYEIILIQERLARCDASTALSVGWHLGFFYNLSVVRPWKEDIFKRLCEEAITSGELLNLFVTEPAGNPGRGGRTQTIARKVPGGYILKGRKSFCTLAPILQRFTVYASLENEETYGEFLVEKSDKIQLVTTWDTMGMRSTGSHDLILDEVFVPEHDLMGEYGSGLERLGKDSGASLFHIPAVYSGIAFSARDLILDFATNYSPPSLQGSISELPHVRAKLGELELELKTARTLLYAAAARWDENIEYRPHMSVEFQHAKHVVCNKAIRIVELAMRIMGGKSLLKANKLERLFRDVHCGLHNPPMDDQVIDGLARNALEEFKKNESTLHKL